METASVVLFFASLAHVTTRVVLAVHEPAALLGAALAAMGGYLLADFFSGLAHWAGDTLGDEHTPLFGKNFVTPFRQHHIDPSAIIRHDFIETNGNSCIFSLPILVALVFLTPRQAGIGLYASVALASTTWFVFCTNQFHKWAHADNPPRLACALQRMHLILAPKHHAIHHAAPHDKYYCITTGWLNLLLHRTRFFRALEALVGWVRPSFLHLAERAAPPSPPAQR